MRLLLVEDDAMIGESVRTGLQQDGFALDWVQDGRAAELALETNALFDYHLRQMAASRSNDSFGPLPPSNPNEIEAEDGLVVQIWDRIAKAPVRRTPDSLDALPEAGLPQKIRPLVHALNDLLGRLARQEPGVAAPVHAPVDLAQLARQVVAEYAPWRRRRTARGYLTASIGAGLCTPLVADWDWQS